MRSDGKIVRSDGKVVSCDGKFVSYGGIVTHCLLDSADLRGMSPAVPKFPWLAWLKSAPLGEWDSREYARLARRAQLKCKEHNNAPITSGS